LHEAFIHISYIKICELDSPNC